MAVWKRILVSGSNISDLVNNVGYATTGSNTFQGNQTINGDVVITGSLTAQQYIISSSVIYVTQSNYSGSNIFGNSMDDTHQFTGSIYLTGSQYFSTADAGVATTGEIGWNTGDQTLDLGLSGSTGAIPILQIGQQQVARVYNAQGTTITKGQVVYVSGSQGNRIAVKLAAATNDANSAGTLGFVLDDIAAGAEGYIQTEGPLYKLNTTGLVVGGLVYLSSSAGQYTQTKPIAPLHEVRLGYVERVSATVGSIYIKIDNGYELEELHNVLISAPSSSGDLLVLSGSIWINSKTLTGSYTLSGSLTTNDGVSVQSLTASFVSASSITGSLFGTASWARSSSQALTASYTPNALVTASISTNVLTFTKGNGTTFNLTVNTGSAVTPGGSDREIQFNSGSAFGGTGKFTYEYDNTSQYSNRLNHSHTEDFRTTAFSTDFKGSYVQENIANNNKQLAGISHWQYSLPATTGATTIYAFDAQGGGPGSLSMHGFKCDYSLLLYDGVSKAASRVGTLIGAWSYDTGITPVIQDTFVDGDQVYNDLGTVVFTLVWNGGNIELQMDCTSVNDGTTHFNGLFTNFGNTI